MVFLHREFRENKVHPPLLYFHSQILFSWHSWSRDCFVLLAHFQYSSNKDCCSEYEFFFIKLGTQEMTPNDFFVIQVNSILSSHLVLVNSIFISILVTALSSAISYSPFLLHSLLYLSPIFISPPPSIISFPSSNLFSLPLFSCSSYPFLIPYPFLLPLMITIYLKNWKRASSLSQVYH